MITCLFCLLSCKRNEERMPEDLFPIHNPDDNGTPVIIPRFRKMVSTLTLVGLFHLELRD